MAFIRIGHVPCRQHRPLPAGAASKQRGAVHELPGGELPSTLTGEPGSQLGAALRALWQASGHVGTPVAGARPSASELAPVETLASDEVAAS